MKSLESRLEALERAAEQAAGEEIVVRVQLVTVHTRAALEALNAYDMAHPQPPRPPPKGRIRLEMLPGISAAECLRQHGVPWPPENIETKGN